MQEGYFVATGSQAGGLINEIETFGLQTGESFGKVGNPEGDMVKTWSSPAQEPAHWAIGLKRLQELQGADKTDPDALSGDFLGGGTGFPCQGFEKKTGLLQGGNRHGDVVQRIRKHVIIGA